MACVFNKQLLHPRNWLTWFGLGILWLIYNCLIRCCIYRHQRGRLPDAPNAANISPGVISNSASWT